MDKLVRDRLLFEENFISNPTSDIIIRERERERDNMKRTKNSCNPIYIHTYKNMNNQFKIEAVLSAGGILALKHALQEHSKRGSLIADDMLADLCLAINDNEDLLKRLSRE